MLGVILPVKNYLLTQNGQATHMDAKPMTMRLIADDVSDDV